jgi:hypothetical protein
MIAVRCRSLLPCIGFHLVHNSLSILNSGMYSAGGEPWLPGLLQPNGVGGYDYALMPSVAMSSAGLLILIWLWFGGMEKRRPAGQPLLSFWRRRMSSAQV